MSLKPITRMTFKLINEYIIYITERKIYCLQYTYPS